MPYLGTPPPSLCETDYDLEMWRRHRANWQAWAAAMSPYALAGTRASPITNDTLADDQRELQLDVRRQWVQVGTSPAGVAIFAQEWPLTIDETARVRASA
ncbi:hypothetical protein PENFLA_c002G04715 [Penicillium flavigenum]|uniref:Uncharacterized protein n=1 Tax=Penicillium flavigenum TaxID=254877 RepID=A0A1V6TXB4_9EURO|nr:hypothetical protein PENFLA_c002G04715 [Penicillium flavigenum]